MVFMNEKGKGYIYLALCILFWASIPVASKKILVELNNLQMLFYSTIFSFLVLGTILLIQKKHKIIGKISKKDYLNMVFFRISWNLSLLYFTLWNICINHSARGVYSSLHFANIGPATCICDFERASNLKENFSNSH